MAARMKAAVLLALAAALAACPLATGGSALRADAGGGGGAGPPDAGLAADAGSDGGEAVDGGADGGPGDDAGPDAGAPSDAGGDAGPACLPVASGATSCAGSACGWSGVNPGELISLGALDPASLPSPRLTLSAAPDAGVLVFSDDPETFPAAGLLYRDTVGPGPVRLFVYHVNGGGPSRKVSVVLENGDPSNAVAVAVTAQALAGPSTNYLYTGKVAAERWLAASPGATLFVPPSQAALLDPALDGLALATGQLVNGIYDLVLGGPLTVEVVALPAGTATLSAYARLSLLAGDGHQRGTFWPDALVAAGDPSCPIDTAAGAFALPLPVSYPVRGTDATTGQTETLGGQYGVLTELTLPVAASDGRRLALLLDPRGGQYGGAALVPSGLTAGGVTALPSNATSALSQGIALGRYDPASEASVGPLVWTLPGGSSAPVDLLLLPY